MSAFPRLGSLHTNHFIPHQIAYKNYSRTQIHHFRFQRTGVDEK